MLFRSTSTGALDSFTVSGEGLKFNIGTSPGSTARIGLPSLLTSSLGGDTGRLSSVGTGGTYSLTSGKSADALRIIDDAIGDATRAQAIVGGFQKFTLDSASRVLSATIENVSSALSAVQDTDLAVESAKLTNNQLLQRSAFEALSITSYRNQDILSLLKSTAARF